LDPYLQGDDWKRNITFVHAFAASVREGEHGKGRKVKADTVSTALTAINQTILLDTNTSPLKIKGTMNFVPLLQQTLDGWRNEDGPVKKKMPVEADVPEWLVKCAYQPGGTNLNKAVADLILIAFYFLLRVGEYTVKGKRNNTKRTVQFRMRDVTFFKKDKWGRLKQIPRNAPARVILAADAATLKLDNQKNGWKGVCISHHSNGEGMFDPVEGLARRYIHIREHTDDPDCYLSAVFEEGIRLDVRNNDISAALKVAAGMLDYPGTRGIPVDSIDTHSLRIGGANALSLAGYSKPQIQKMGRWRGETFMEYIRESLSDFSEGMSNSMKKCFGFVSLEAGVYTDVTDTVVGMEYEAGAAEQEE
jgi:hypothetical protein